MKNEILREVSLSLNNDDIENSSKRILDLTWYYFKESQEYVEALEIRKEYNLTRTLGQREIDSDQIDHFSAKLKKLLSKIESKDIIIKDPVHELLIGVKDLKKTFKHFSKNFSFGPVSIDINKGEIVGVVGENGNGKTTFLRLLQEEISKDEGELIHNYKFQDIAASDFYKRKNRTAFIPQRIPKWRGTLMENLVFFASIHGYNGKSNDQIVSYVIHRMGLTAFTGLSWSQISSGYKLRFELAKMLVWEPDVLILDEPLANLDLQASQNLLDDLRFFADSTVHPIGILLTSQQLHSVEQISDKVLFLRNGKSIFCGNRNDFEQSRTERIIEISINSNPDKIEEILSGMDVRINASNQIIRINFSKQITTSTILSLLLNSGVELTYFRDITNSTVQLFSH